MDDKNRRDFGQQKPQKPKNVALILVVTSLAFIFLLYINRNTTTDTIAYTEFLEYLDKNKIQKVKVDRRKIEASLVEKDETTVNKKPRILVTYIPLEDNTLLVKLLDKKVEVVGEADSDGFFVQIFTNLIPWLLILGILWFIMFRQIQGSGNKALSFGKSRARLQKPSSKKTTFDDVAGVEEAKEELAEVVEFLRFSDKFKKLGAKIPKGVLLMGPPGTGKTLLARAIAGEASVPFFSMSGSDFVEMFVGVGASRVRDLFETGKKNAPCILFIDELDAVGRVRGAGYGGGHDEREQTLNQMLVEMDGFDTDDTVIVVAATNRPDVLDPALLRPGRFDRQIVVSRPDIKGREGILKVHLKKIITAKSVDPKTIARGTPGFSGADLANLVNESALIAARRNKRKVQMDDFEYAKDKVLMGPERRSLVINKKERTITAYHEAGHAILSLLLEHTDPLHKVSIIPRGRALGVTQSLPIDDRYTYSKPYLLDTIVTILGGRVAEEYKFGKDNFSNGAANDIEQASKLSRAMICEWGMSETLGPISYGQKEEPIFIGKEIARHKDYSEETAKVIDAEIKIIIMSSLEKARNMIKENYDKMELLAKSLLERETMDREEIEMLLGFEPKVKEDEEDFDQAV